MKKIICNANRKVISEKREMVVENAFSVAIEWNGAFAGEQLVARAEKAFMVRRNPRKVGRR